MFVLIGIDLDVWDGIIEDIKVIDKSNNKNDLEKIIENIKTEVSNKYVTILKYQEEHLKKIKKEFDILYEQAENKYVFYQNYVKEEFPKLCYQGVPTVHQFELFSLGKIIYHKDYNEPIIFVENAGYNLNIIEV
jgi:hypothetical protein